MTDDPQVIRLLEEIRDQQAAHLELYKQALRNQAESIEMQRQMQATAQRRLRLLPVLLFVILGLLGVVLFQLWQVLRRWS